MSLYNQQVELTLEAVGERLDRALAEALPELSRMQWQRLIREGQVTVDGVRAKSSYRIAGGETLVANIPEVVEVEIAAEDIPLDIRYEDKDLIVVNKPAGMVVHPSFGHAGGTLVNALLAHCPDLEGVGDERPRGARAAADGGAAKRSAVAHPGYARDAIHRRGLGIRERRGL